MTKTDYLNMASDLRRAAYWTATGTNSKLVTTLLMQTKRVPRLNKYLHIDFNLKGKHLAEELLMASRKLQKLTL